jgi:hypothetical protein
MKLQRSRLRGYAPRESAVDSLGFLPIRRTFSENARGIKRDSHFG